MISGTMPHIGKESTVFALGKLWTLSRFDLRIWDKLIEWAKARIPDPFAGLERMAKMIPEDAPPTHPLVIVFNTAMQKAQERAATVYTIDSPELHALIDTMEGQIERFRILLLEHHPEITRETVVDILCELGEARQEKAIEEAAGKLPPAVGNAVAPAA